MKVNTARKKDRTPFRTSGERHPARQESHIVDIREKRRVEALENVGNHVVRLIALGGERLEIDHVFLRLLRHGIELVLDRVHRLHALFIGIKVIGKPRNADGVFKIRLGRFPIRRRP